MAVCMCVLPYGELEVSKVEGCTHGGNSKLQLITIITVILRLEQTYQHTHKHTHEHVHARTHTLPHSEADGQV